MTNIWYCKTGTSDNVPQGGDWPMRQAVEEAFRKVTGDEPAFTFSGWGAELTEVQQAVVENREPDFDKVTFEVTRKRYRELMVAEAKLAALEAAGVDNWDGYSEVEWPVVIDD